MCYHWWWLLLSTFQSVLLQQQYTSQFLPSCLTSPSSPSSPKRGYPAAHSGWLDRDSRLWTWGSSRGRNKVVKYHEICRDQIHRPTFTSRTRIFDLLPSPSFFKVQRAFRPPAQEFSKILKLAGGHGALSDEWCARFAVLADIFGPFIWKFCRFFKIVLFAISIGPVHITLPSPSIDVSLSSSLSSSSLTV